MRVAFATFNLTSGVVPMSIDNLVKVCDEMSNHDAEDMMVAMISAVWPHITMAERNILLIKLITDWHGADMYEALLESPIAKW